MSSVDKDEVSKDESAGTSSLEDHLLLTTSQLQSLSNFYILHEIGEGSFSTVFLASTKSKHIRYALKVCSKVKIKREKKVKEVFRERDNLNILSTDENQRPFIVRLYATFQDTESLYFVLTYAPHRDLGEKVGKKAIESNVAKFLSAEICLALDYIHSHGILHRDIKPENLLIKEDFHLMLSDFGCSIRVDEMEKRDDPAIKRKSSFVGSHLYVCPEILNGEQIDETCDYFSVGSIIFEMLAGRSPFYDISEYLVFRRIVNNTYTFPDDFSDLHAKDLIKGLLHPKLEERYGTKAKGGSAVIKSHPFFESVNWNTLATEESPFSTYFKPEVNK